MSSRKAEMILELVDRATRPARRFMALQRRMGKATEKSNQRAAKSAKKAEQATGLYARAARTAARAQKVFQGSIRRSNQLIRQQVIHLRKATGLMRSGVMGMGRAAVLAGGMFAAYAGTMSFAAASFLGPARQFENFGVQLESIEGSSGKARAAMQWIEDFATRTPLELNQVVQAYQQMRTFGMDPTNGSMMALVDTMAASGKGAEQLNGLVLALGKSWTKGKLQGEEIMMLMERGVPVWEMLAQKTGKNVKQLQAMSSAGKLGRREIQLLIDAMAEKNAGASEKMSRTWDGIISNLLDWWTRFQRMVMGFGVFDWMKERLRGILDMLNAMEASGELEVWAKAIADNILTALNAVWNFGAAALRFWKAFYPWLKSASEALGGWRNLALAVVAIPFRSVIFGAAFSLFQFAGGAALAMKSLAGIGFGSAMRGALGFGRVLWTLTNPLNWIKGAFVALRVAILSTGIGALALGLAMAGVWIYNNWAGLQNFFRGFGKAFMKSLGPARPLAEAVIGSVRKLWRWLARLVRPLDVSAQQWQDWGRMAGRSLGMAVDAVRRFAKRISAWFGQIGQIEWSRLLTLEGLKDAWSAVANWVSEQAASLWAGINPLNWPDYIKEIDWMSLTGGAFLLGTLIKPIIWTAKLIGAPIKWAFLGGKFALSTLIKPISWTVSLLGGAVKWSLLGAKFALSSLLKPITWTASLITKVPWLKLAGGGAKFMLSTLVKPIAWTSALISKIPWMTLAGGGRKFALKGLLTSLKWTSKLIPGIGWAVLAGELAWDLLISKIDWSSFDWLNFDWADILPAWNWGSIIPGTPKIDIDQITRESVVKSGSLDRSKMSEKQLAVLRKMDAWRAKRRAEMRAEKAPPALIDDPKTLLAAADAAAKLEKQFPAISKAAEAALGGVATTLGAIKILLGQTELTSLGAGLMNSLAAGIRSKVADVTAAALEITHAIRTALPSSATMQIGVKGRGESAVQERARGGAFNPGWLLTGENGPELEYRSRGGFIAHNRALANMVSMSETVARNSANANHAPGWLRGAALATGIAASVAMPAAALDLGADGSAGGGGAQYLTTQNSANSTTVSAPITLTIQGNVDQSVMPDLKSALAELEDRLVARLEDEARAAHRREHS